MGEFAIHKGQQVKIGTCEDMYYLRADQATQVTPERNSVNPVKDAAEIRFRFPWPDEDTIEPGNFDNPFRTMAVWGVEHPVPFDHGTVQFTAQPGYVLSIPCPEGPGALPDLRVGKNGWKGTVHLVQQRVWEGRLVTVCQCGGCGSKYRLETLEQVEPVLVGLRSMADTEQQTADRNDTPGNADIARRYHEIADRITAGYRDPLPF